MEVVRGDFFLIKVRYTIGKVPKGYTVWAEKCKNRIINDFGEIKREYYAYKVHYPTTISSNSYITIADEFADVLACSVRFEKEIRESDLMNV